MIGTTILPKIGETSVKNHFSKMKRDIGMVNYEIKGNKRLRTPSLYLYRTVTGQ